MVEPAERMRKAVNEAMRVADPGMRQGGGRHERDGGGECADQTTVHGGFLPLQGKNIETKLHIKRANARQERAAAAPLPCRAIRRPGPATGRP
jgi:hypothetical protein